MRKKSFEEIPKIVAQSNRRRKWRKVVGVLGCIVAFSTIHALILPAITMEKAPVSGTEDDVHIHDESCYSIPEAHVHGDDCYTQERGDLICTIPEGEPAHTHSPEAGCYEETQELVCPLEESEEHRHGDACYEVSSKLICALSDQPHQHTDECYAWSNVLTCTESTDAAEPVLICGREEILLPQPQEYCYEDDSVLVTVVLPAESKVPQDASLRVVPINQTEDRYSLLEQQAQATVEGELNQLVLYDVSFYTKDGAYLPVEDSAAVTITFKQEVLTGDQVEVIHYGENAAPVALEGVEIQRDENQVLSGIAFQTEGFSVFGVMTTRASTDVSIYPGQVYTVDDVYTGDVQIAGDGNAVIADMTAYTDILRLDTGNHLYTGTRVNVEDALYTFTAVGEENSNTFTISHDTIYLNFKDAGTDGICLSSNIEDTILITDKTDTNNSNNGFLEYDRFALSSGDQYLFFHGKKGDDNQYAFNLKPDSWLQWCGGGFLLFRKAVDGEQQSAVIPGFVQVTQKSDIVSGEKYLIAAKAQDRESYYVLYPNLNATERHQHAAMVSLCYELTLTGNTAGTTTVTAGTQTWNVTVNDIVTVSPEKSVSIPLPEGAEITSEDPAIASAAIENGTATVTGLKMGETTATVTVNDQTYTWRIHVTRPVSFQFTYNGTVITFHLRDANTHEDLPVDALTDYVGGANTKYCLVPEGAGPEETENQKNIVIPQIEGYQFSQAMYHRAWGNTYHKITCFATTGYSDSHDNISVPKDKNYLFYDEASPSPELDLGKDVPTVDIYLDYRKLPLTNTVSPSGTIINLFDYWVTGEDEGQAWYEVLEGINKDHDLRFVTKNEHPALKLNTYWGNSVNQGIVANRLGSDGYPHLSGNEAVTGTASNESLAYLFDPSYTGPSSDFRKAYRNVGGLLQLDDKGYYYYDSTKNYAEYDEVNNRFHLYPDWAVTHTSVDGQFFPFDAYSTVSQETQVAAYNQNGDLNHFFGLSMSTRFMQQFGGHTSQQEEVPMTFEFAGDDDVWIFIDGVLVADLGGIHDAASVKIDFAAGKVVINGNRTTNFSDIFAGTNVELTENGVTFKDNSYHTLKFYYMERGGVASNLHLKFNLVTFPASGITKVDQVGDPITGAEFALYRTGADYVVPEGAAPICFGSTDADGEFVFTDGEGHPLVLQDLYLGRDKNQPDTTSTNPYYVLKEIRVPQGYRGTGTDIHLEITEGSGSGLQNVKSYVMTCTNTRDSGAYASPSLQVTASNELTLADGRKISPGVSQGTLFGIVLKYIGPAGEGKNLENEDYWSPVYGSASEGYTVVDREQYPQIQDAIQAAKDQYTGNQNYFHQSSNGSFQALIEDLPGDIASYNFMVGNDHPDKVQYIVAYYWTDAATNKTTRVQDYTINGGTYSFSRTFGTDIHIPNMKNRIAVQKLDEDNATPVNGARFAMYRVDDQADATVHHTEAYYYVPDQSADEDNKIHIFMGPDIGGTCQGQARLCTDTAYTGSYVVDRQTGMITVTIADSPSGNNAAYYITPTQVVTTADSAHNNYKEDGIAEFEGMVSGKYIIRELTAPTGYEVNPNCVMVLITDNAIYANAGDADDGIAVSRGPGYLAGNLHYYATRGDIDNTLSWIYTQMKVSGVSHSFADVAAGKYSDWKWIQTRRADAYTLNAQDPTADRDNALTAYLKYSADQISGSDSESNARFSYVVDDDTGRLHTVSENVALERRLYTKTGWSYLEILQDYEYGHVSSPDGPKAPNANYENWQYVPGTTTPDDLSNLFSRSVYVHVTDTKLPGNLEITKTVVPKKEEWIVPDKVKKTSFTFTVTLTNPAKTVDGTYKYTVYDNFTGARTVAMDADGKKLENLDLTFTGGTARLSLKDDQAAVIQGIPAESTYEITEVSTPKFTTTAKEKVLNTDTEGTSAGIKDHDGSVVSGSMYWHVEKDALGNDVLDNLSKVDFTNIYDEALDTGYELPETGGMGTILIYILGGILVMGAGLPLVNKKRKGAK